MDSYKEAQALLEKAWALMDKRWQEHRNEGLALQVRNNLETILDSLSLGK